MTIVSRIYDIDAGTTGRPTGGIEAWIQRFDGHDVLILTGSAFGMDAIPDLVEKLQTIQAEHAAKNAKG